MVYLGRPGINGTGKVRQTTWAKNYASFLSGQPDLIQLRGSGERYKHICIRIILPRGKGVRIITFLPFKVICKDAPMESFISRHFNRQSIAQEQALAIVNWADAHGNGKRSTKI